MLKHELEREVRRLTDALTDANSDVEQLEAELAKAKKETEYWKLSFNKLKDIRK